MNESLWNLIDQFYFIGLNVDPRWWFCRWTWLPKKEACVTLVLETALGV